MKATDPAIAAALARMDTRARGFEPILWKRQGKAPNECLSCGARSTMLLYRVTPHRRTEANPWAAWRRWSTLHAFCVDEAACRARSSRAYEQRSRRTGTLRWAQSRFESPDIDLPKGSCRWCGEPIVFVQGADYRVKQRARHRGDEYEVTDHDCRREHDRTFAFTGRWLIIYRGDPCCVDCGQVDSYWEADHDLALEDGGAHDPTNIVRRCGSPCHAQKTARENAARRAKRAVDKAQGAA